MASITKSISGGKAGASLKWFSDKGHEQIIAGHYNGDVKANFQRWHQAAADVDRVTGYMDTTWRQK